MTEDMGGVQLRLVESLDDLLALREWLGWRRPVLGVDTETGGLDWWREPLRLVQIGDAMTGWAVPYAPWAGALKEMLDAYDRPVVMHNAKFDEHVLESAPVPIRIPRRLVEDSAVAVRLVDTGKSSALKNATARRVHPRAGSGGVVLKDAFSGGKWDWRTIPVDHPAYWQYGALDPVLAARLWEQVEPELRAGYGELYETEIACQMVLMDMERRGARVDLDYVRARRAELQPYLREMKVWIRAEFGVSNPGSDAQCIKRLHEYGLSWTKRTEKGNIALDDEVLGSLDHPFAAALRQYREADKIEGTYLKNFEEFADRDGFVHTSINSLGARTGRMTSERPALHNLPRRRYVRRSFIPRDGHRLALCDYDQIEMRLLAHFAGEQAMIDAIRRGDELAAAGHPGFDVHSMNARQVYRIPETEPVPKKQRDVTKNAGFAKIYGAGIEQFARTARVTVAEAEEFLARFDAAYPGVTRFQGEVGRVGAQRLAADGVPWVREPSGRRHVAERDKIYVLTNYLIQGTAATVLKRAMVRLDQHGLSDRLILPVHDELIADVPAEDAEEYGAAMRDVMADRESWAVPLTTDLEIVDDWGAKYE